MKRYLWLLLFLLLPACKSSQTAQTPARHRIAFVTNNASDFWMIARNGVEKAHAELPNVDH